MKSAIAVKGHLVSCPDGGDQYKIGDDHQYAEQDENHPAALQPFAGNLPDEDRP